MVTCRDKAFCIQSRLLRNILTVLAAGVVLALLFTSCFSYPVKAENFTQNIVYWDENLPREESVELAFFAPGLTVTSYNGIPVEWGKKPLVFLPPGPAAFTVDLARFDTTGVLLNGSSAFVWNFKAGDRYSIQGGTRNGKPGILLWNLEVKTKTEDMDFFPFPEPGKTVLE
ncbi:MAG: hypothetical protein LBK74_11005 [Treponema sp.]|jgi:hypothetical protein|nr:hypothetical protein [Treponema sp.]